MHPVVLSKLQQNQWCAEVLKSMLLLFLTSVKSSPIFLLRNSVWFLIYRVCLYKFACSVLSYRQTIFIGFPLIAFLNTLHFSEQSKSL